MFADDFINVGFRFVVIPNFFWVHDHHRSFVAAIQTTCVVYANAALSSKAQTFDFFLRVIAKVTRAALAT